MTEHLLNSLAFIVTVITLMLSLFTALVIVVWKVSALNSQSEGTAERVKKLETRQENDIKDIREKIDKIYEKMMKSR